MADGGGASSSSSNEPMVAVTGGQDKPSLDGEFLLQLLRRPSQTQTPTPSPSPSPPLLPAPHHYYDPAVAALGRSRPFPPPNFHIPPETLPFAAASSSPAFPGFPHARCPPPGFPAPGPDYQRFAFPAADIGARTAPPTADDLRRNLGPVRRDVVSSDNSILFGSLSCNFEGFEGNKGSGSRPGARKITPGFGPEVDRGLEGSRQQKAQQVRSQGPLELNYFHHERERGASLGDRRPTVFQSSGVVERGGLPGLSHRSQGLGQWVANNERHGGKYNVDRREDNRRQENHQSVPSYPETSQRQLLDSRGSHGDGPLQSPDRSGFTLGSNQQPVARSEIREPMNGLHNEVGEGHISGAERPENMNRGGMGAFASGRNGCEEQDLLVDQLVRTLIPRAEPADKNMMRHLHTSSGKEFKTEFPRGRRVSSQRMRIRRDIETLTPCFLSIYESLIPAEEEKAKQNQLLLSLGKLVNQEWPNAQLHLYGSCANSFGVSQSDIDLCLAIADADISKSDVLLKLADILQSNNLQNVQALTRARVPIVKLMDPVTGISCDICINNLLAVVNTKLLRDYAQIDDRLRQLAFIVKHWAKLRGVNETYQGTLSSYAYVLMCIHFLQLRKPAVLPCLQEMEATYVATVDDTECAYFDQVEKLRNFGAQNKESIAQLVWAFFHYWAYHHDYANDVISVRTGSIISKRVKDWTRRIGNDRHLICIEDPFEISHDLGRVVDKYSIKILREEFERAADILQYDPNPSVKLFEPYVPPSSGN